MLNIILNFGNKIAPLHDTWIQINMTPVDFSKWDGVSRVKEGQPDRQRGRGRKGQREMCGLFSSLKFSFAVKKFLRTK